MMIRNEAPMSRRAALRAAAAMAALALAGSAGAATPAALVEGKNFARLANPQPVETGKKIEVIEFFSYGCPHCAALEPYLDKWLATLPSDVSFRRVPVMFHEAWVRLARVYYTLDAMGDARKLSPDVFKAIHVDGVDLTNDKTFFDWAAKHGLDAKQVAAVYTSFAVDSKLKRAMQLGKDYGIESVPTEIVDGKFITSSDRLGGHAAVPAALDALIAKARAERAKG
ncbi:MAG: thiol:disulfide interchange protein DsbA/DsbL [Proteobacteria bacterium]|nr:thiol:disulfide interchange protein DsbA/DsbL [Pseudomonadota bacterium]